jgi:hypothetical protein
MLGGCFRGYTFGISVQYFNAKLHSL